MKVIEITEDKVSGLAEHIEKALRHAGKAMQCVEGMYDDYGYGERGGYGERDEDDYDDDDRMGERRYGRGRGMGMRRRRDYRGRYM